MTDFQAMVVLVATTSMTVASFWSVLMLGVRRYNKYRWLRMLRRERDRTSSHMKDAFGHGYHYKRTTRQFFDECVRRGYYR